jgi:hypothetical protein
MPSLEDLAAGTAPAPRSLRSELLFFLAVAIPCLVLLYALLRL